MIENIEAQGPKSIPVVLRCIDHRTNAATHAHLEQQGLRPGDYKLHATAGAAGNPGSFTQEEVLDGQVHAVNHRDCGYYKMTGGDDHDRHTTHLDQLAQQFPGITPHVIAHEHLDNSTHQCQVAAVILGEPDVVQHAFNTLAETPHDVIARLSLSHDDPTLHQDIEIARNLHRIELVLIFERDETRAGQLAESIKAAAPNLGVHAIVLK